MRHAQATTLTDRHAMVERLLRSVAVDRRLGAEALAVFRAAIDEEQDPRTLILAARGIGLVGGAEAGRDAWRALLARPEPETVAAVAYAVDDPLLAPELRFLIEPGADPAIGGPAMRALGRMKDASALPVIAQALAEPALRTQAIYALTDLGNPLAIPHLETVLGDTADAWERDDHCAVPSVGALAASAIQHLRGGDVIQLGYGTSAPRRWASAFTNTAMAILGAIMAVGGVWLALSGDTMKDRAAGAVGALLFGAAAYGGMRGLRAYAPAGTPLNYAEVNGNRATGGAGGSGGSATTSFAGGDGGNGQGGGIFASVAEDEPEPEPELQTPVPIPAAIAVQATRSKVNNNTATGGAGGNGGSSPETGGDGGDGGAARGGGIFAGSFIIGDPGPGPGAAGESGDALGGGVAASVIPNTTRIFSNTVIAGTGGLGAPVGGANGVNGVALGPNFIILI